MTITATRISSFDEIPRTSRNNLYFIDSGESGYGVTRFKNQNIPGSYPRVTLELYPGCHLPFVARNPNNGNTVILLDLNQLDNHDPLLSHDIKSMAHQLIVSPAPTNTSPPPPAPAVERTFNAPMAVQFAHPNYLSLYSGNFAQGVTARLANLPNTLDQKIATYQNKINEMTEQKDRVTQPIDFHPEFLTNFHPSVMYNGSTSKFAFLFSFEIDSFKDENNVIYHLRPDGEMVTFTVRIDFKLAISTNGLSVVCQDIDIFTWASNYMLPQNEPNVCRAHPVMSGLSRPNSNENIPGATTCVGSALDAVRISIGNFDFMGAAALVRESFNNISGSVLTNKETFFRRDR
jgi:hypothetical protein